MTVLIFAFVGGVGFLVDATIFWCLYALADMDLNAARVIAFLVAMLTTWLGNRYLTFKASAAKHFVKQLIKHSCTASFSFLVNLAIFNLIVMTTNFIVLAFVLGVVVAFVSNFLLSKYFVFAH